jgi:glycosyltransferase involved in cell wall biosynthesis
MTANGNPKDATHEVVVLTPVYNDGESLRALLAELDQVWSSDDGRLCVIVINDGSSEPIMENLQQGTYHQIHQIDQLDLVCNQGHQRAIAVGLCHVMARSSITEVVVMDADGEDRPGDIQALLKALRAQPQVDVVFAERARRSESLVFRMGYHAYRVLHWLTTGMTVRFGNFSVLRPRAITTLGYQSALWNHYAASVVRARIPFTCVPLARGYRYAGTSKLNVPHWVAHGFSALSVFYDVVCARVASAVVLLLLALNLGCALAWLTGRLSLGPLLVVSGFSLLLALGLFLQVIALVALRSSTSVVPARDAGHWIRRATTIWNR